MPLLDRRTALAIFAASSLVACGKNEPADDPMATEAEAASVSYDEITRSADAVGPEPLALQVTDTLGQFEGDVSGLAMWQHPGISYRSAVLAGNGAAGIYIIPMDRGPGDVVEGEFSGGVAVGYRQAAAVAAAYDSSANSVALFAIDPATRSLGPVGLVRVNGGAKALCMTRNTLIRITDAGDVVQHSITADEGRLGFDSTPVDGIKADDCAATTNDIHLLLTSGRVRTVSSADGLIDGSVDGAPGARSLAAVAGLDKDHLILVNREGELMVEGTTISVNGENGPVSFVSATAGSGNYGGVYRNGVIAAITDENELVLLPWLSIARRVGLEPETMSPIGNNAGVSSALGASRPTLDADALSGIDQEALEALRTPPAPAPEVSLEQE